jgi:hypothetical protein
MKSEAIAICKVLLVFPVKKVVYKKRIIEKSMDQHRGVVYRYHLHMWRLRLHNGARDRIPSG